MLTLEWEWLLILLGWGGDSGSPHGLHWHCGRSDLITFQFSSVQLLSRVRLFATWLMAKVLLCARAPLTLSQCAREGAHYCWVGEKVPILHVVSTDTIGRRRLYYWPAEVKVSAFYLAFFDSTLVKVLEQLLRELNSKLSCQPFKVWLGVESQFS